MANVAVILLVVLPAWMSGTWRSTSASGSVTEEVWSTAEGTLMTGMHRNLRPGKATWFEFLRIERRGEELVYVAMPGGGTPTEFKATHVENGTITFENPAHDFPKRIRYWKEGAQLCASVDAGDGAKSQRWCWQRAAPESTRPE